jgi:hypothetical protein
MLAGATHRLGKALLAEHVAGQADVAAPESTQVPDMVEVA